MTCRRHPLGLLASVMLGCAPPEGDLDTAHDPGTGDPIDVDLVTSRALCDDIAAGPANTYPVGNTVDAAPMADIEGLAGEIDLSLGSGFVGFQPSTAGTWTVAMTEDLGLIVIDTYGRSPELIGVTQPSDCDAIAVETTVVLNTEVYWLLLDDSAPTVTMVARLAPSAAR